jgi:hypothetical protein
MLLWNSSAAGSVRTPVSRSSAATAPSPTGTYRPGTSAGTPDAVQVSDRFHFWQRLSRRVRDVAAAHRGCLSAELPTASETDAGPVEEVEETAENAAADSRVGRYETEGCSRLCMP